MSNLRQQNPFVCEVEKKGFIRRFFVQGGSNMTGTDLCVNMCKQSRSYLNHLVHDVCYVLAGKADGLTRVRVASQSCF